MHCNGELHVMSNDVARSRKGSCVIGFYSVACDQQRLEITVLWDYCAFSTVTGSIVANEGYGCAVATFAIGTPLLLELGEHLLFYSFADL